MSDYDNIYLIPKEVSTIEHRADVDLHSDILGLYPLVSSPMTNISGADLVIEMAKNSCLGILHRFHKRKEKRLEDINKISHSGMPFGVAIGIKNWEYELSIATYAVAKGAVLICVDIANGYLPQLKNIGLTLRNEFPNTFLLGGNVVDFVGTNYLKECGFDMIRVGIGNGSMCTTRLKAGIGRNQLAALKDCRRDEDVYLVSDGGLSIPANVVKSFALGADFGMLGTVLKYAEEAELWNPEDPNDRGYAFGMASERNQKNLDNAYSSTSVRNVEGKEEKVDEKLKKPLKVILNDYLDGIRSACTYLNCWEYGEISNKALICPVEERVW